jgi:ERCC4-type nuclease
LYAECLQFLLKVTGKDETHSSILGEQNNECTETKEEEETVHAVQEMDEASTSIGDAGTLHHRKRKASQADEIERKILKSLEKMEPDEDEAFYRL